MNMTQYAWRELKSIMKKYNIIIRWEEATNKYYVYTKSGKLEFVAVGFHDLITTCHLYYD